MEKVTFVNSKGLSVEMGNERPFILRKFEGAGVAGADIQTQKAPYQDGVTYIDNVLQPRSLSIELTVLAENSSEMAERRRELAQVFNPKLGPGVLAYEFGGSRKEIDAIAELGPVFPYAAPFEDVMQPGLISLYCPNPYWRDAEKRISLPNGDLIAVDNMGDVDASPEFVIYGPAENPRIENLSIAKSMFLLGNISEGEQINITTAQGQKAIVLVSAEGHTNIFNWYDATVSEFIWLLPGVNVLRYTATGGTFADITYCNLFVGV